MDEEKKWNQWAEHVDNILRRTYEPEKGTLVLGPLTEEELAYLLRWYRGQERVGEAADVARELARRRAQGDNEFLRYLILGDHHPKVAVIRQEII